MIFIHVLIWNDQVTTMTILACPIPGCGFTTQDVDVIGAAAILNVHSNVHTAAPSPALPMMRGPKLERPKLQLNSTNEDWNAFSRRWETFRVGSGIHNDAASGQLLECTSERLGNIVLRADPMFTSKPLTDSLKILKSIAVVTVALGVLRSELFTMRQDPDETFRTFSARVQGKAEVCEFKTSFDTSCSNCNTVLSGHTYYTDEAIRDVLLNGIADIDIRREALSSDGIQVKPVSQVVAFVESREIARNANSSSSSALSALSAYRRSNDNHPRNQRAGTPSSVTERSKTAKCPDCGDTYHLFTQKTRGWNRIPHKQCEKCWKRTRGIKSAAENNTIMSVHNDSVGQISSNDAAVPLSHHIFNKGEWRRARITDHPRISLELTAGNRRPVSVTAVADSGAQSNLWSMEGFLQAGFIMKELSPVSLSLNAANKSPIRIDGAFFARITGKSPEGDTVVCHTMVYVSRDVRSLYLSFDTMLDLGILNRNFPKIGHFSKPVGSSNEKGTKKHPWPATTRSEQYAVLIMMTEAYASARCDNPHQNDLRDFHFRAQLKTTPGWRRGSWIDTRAQRLAYVRTSSCQQWLARQLKSIWRKKNS